MRKSFVALAILLTGVMAYAQNVVISVAAKSPVILYNKLNAIVNQLPPEAAMYKMMATMYFTFIGAPNFDGVDPNANMGLCLFDDGSAVFVLNASDNAQIYQLLKNSCSHKRLENWSTISGKVNFELSNEGVEFGIKTEDVSPISDEAAKLAIETLQANLDADLLVKIHPDSIGRLMHQDAPEKFKALFNDEIESVTYSLSLNDSKAETNFQILAKSGSVCEKILKSLRKADEIPEAKFVSKDHYLTFESSLVSTKETISAISELFEKYFNIEKSQLEMLQKLPVGAGTRAEYRDYGEDSVSIKFSKSQLTAEEYLAYRKLTLNSVAEILKHFLTKDLDNPNFKALTISDKSECEIDSVKLLSWKENKSYHNIASVNGFLISSNFDNSQESDSENGKELVKEAIEVVKSGKLAENPLPSKIDDDFLTTYNFSKIKGEKDLEELAAKIAPIVYRGNIEGSGLSIKTEIPTDDIVKFLNLRVKISALEKEKQKKEAPAKEKESEAPQAPRENKTAK